MIDRKAAGRYSAALFELAKESHSLEPVDRDLLRVKELCGQHPEIANLVSNSTVSRTEKEDFIDKIVPADLTRLVVHFMKVLIKKIRFRELALIQENFHKRYEREKGIREVEVRSAHALASATLEKLRAVLKKKLSAEIRLLPKIDPHLMGGMVLRFEDLEVNASFRSRLEEIKQSLLQEPFHTSEV